MKIGVVIPTFDQWGSVAALRRIVEAQDGGHCSTVAYHDALLG
jgi:hypothetical protein